MFMNVLPNLCLIFVPALFYSFCGVMALTSLVMILPKIFFRTVIVWPEHSTALTPTELWARDLIGNYFCERGEIINPDIATVYLTADTDFYYYDNEYSNRHRFMNTSYSYVEEVISRAFHNVILECPNMYSVNNAFYQNHTARTMKYLKKIATFNSRQPSKQSKIKVWLRLRPNNNNGIYFEDFYCLSLASATNRMHPKTVVGVLVDADILPHQTHLKSLSFEWEAYTNMWKARVRRFQLQLGLMLTIQTCMNLRDQPSLTNALERFDEIFYFTEGGYAWLRADEGHGGSAIISKKYHACRSLVAVKSPKAVEVKHALGDIHLLFGCFIDYEFSNHCIIYDWRA